MKFVKHGAAALFTLAATMCPAPGANAGPPYVLDDAEPTDYRRYEIYAFTTGTVTHDGTDGEAGIDFNYGGAPDLQLTAVLPVGYSAPAGGAFGGGLGNIELAAKYRFLHQDEIGVDVAIFPRVFLPAGSEAAGQRHASLFVPVWLQKDWGDWSAFGGGGCELNRSGDSRDFCIGGAVITRRVLPDLQLGLELYHESADVKDGPATTSVGAGITYDLSDNYHLLAYAGRGLQNAATINEVTWYSSILFTF